MNTAERIKQLISEHDGKRYSNEFYELFKPIALSGIEAGKSHKQIAAEWGLSYMVVIAATKYSKPTLSDEEKELLEICYKYREVKGRALCDGFYDVFTQLVAQLVGRGMTVSQIYHMTNFSADTIKKAIRTAGICYESKSTPSKKTDIKVEKKLTPVSLNDDFSRYNDWHLFNHACRAFGGVA